MTSIRASKLVSMCGALAALSTTLVAQHAQVSAVAVRPNNLAEAWVVNRDNGSVSVINIIAGHAVAEIDVGVWPRSLAFTPDSSRVFVANQRGNVPVDVHAGTPFVGTEIRGSVSVIDVATKTVIQTIPSAIVGVEPYGLAVAPNGKYFAVSAMRSGRIELFDAVTLANVAEFQYDDNLNFLTLPKTIATVDENRDGMADLADPRGFVIRADSQRLYVTHNKSPYISALNVTLNGSGIPTGISLAAKISVNDYTVDPIFNPVPVQILQSQGLPRFLEDVTLSPDGSRAVVPHVLHNINHDVNHAFGPSLPGDFANRVYPAVTVLDAVTNTFKQAGDNSARLHNQLADPIKPAEYASFGSAATTPTGSKLLIGATGSPISGGTFTFQVDGIPAGMNASVFIGTEVNMAAGNAGTQYATVRRIVPVVGGVATLPVPSSSALVGAVFAAQAVLFDANGARLALSNGLRLRIETVGVPSNTLGHRGGHPSRVAFNSSGNRMLVLNRGSEDLFLYEVSGNNYTLRDVFPPRINFVPRTALDVTTPMGDLPLGMAMANDGSTPQDDSLVYVMNELTRTLSVLRVGWTTATIVMEKAQIPTLLNADQMTLSQRIGDELFEDASRAQTTGAPGTVGEFNNSCASCHFEGGEDGNVWQRPAGPRSTMPVFGGTLGSGRLLWKGVRFNMGETGPMFTGENGGTGVLTDAEQQALIDNHNVTPVPLNPNRDPATGGLTPLAALGRDLFLGDNLTGLNPTLRRAGCADCHPAQLGGTSPSGFTTDELLPIYLTGFDAFVAQDPLCNELKQNIAGTAIRDVNSGANVDADLDGFPDVDRNADGFPDVETYAIMNSDKDDDFKRDDDNSWPCPENGILGNPKINFGRFAKRFSVPTKLGLFTSGPYFHDHSAFSLRTLVDPSAQEISPIYGTPAYPAIMTPLPGLKKMFNEFHDIRGHEDFVQGASKVQINLQSPNKDADIDAILAFIQSL